MIANRITIKNWLLHYLCDVYIFIFRHPMVGVCVELMKDWSTFTPRQPDILGGDTREPGIYNGGRYQFTCLYYRVSFNYLSWLIEGLAIISGKSCLSAFSIRKHCEHGEYIHIGYTSEGNFNSEILCRENSLKKIFIRKRMKLNHEKKNGSVPLPKAQCTKLNLLFPPCYIISMEGGAVN